jgi:hypothetical protein
LQARDACFTHLGFTDARPTHLQTGSLSHLRHKHPLSAPIAFPEWVDEIEFDQECRGSLRELGSVHVFEEVSDTSVFEQLRQALGHLDVGHEVSVSFGNVHLTKLPGPRVDVTKDLVMQVLQVSD